MLRICPGYKTRRPHGPVARARRSAPPPGENRRVLQSFPEVMPRICPGYKIRRLHEPVARARRSAPPPGKTASCTTRHFLF